MDYDTSRKAIFHHYNERIGAINIEITYNKDVKKVENSFGYVANCLQ